MSSPVIRIGTEVDLLGAQQIEQIAEVVVAAMEKMGVSFKDAEAKGEESALGIKEAFQTMAEGVETSMEGLNTAIASTGGAISALGAILGVAMVGEFINGVKESLLQVDHLSEATGMSVESLTEWKDVMEASGASTERLPQQLTKLSQAMEAAAQGSQKQVDMFHAMGIETAGWAEKMPDANSVLLQMADHLHSSTNATEDLSNASRILGRGSVELIATLKEGSAAIEQQKQAHAAHAQAVAESVGAAKALQAQEEELKSQLETALMPAFQALVTLVELVYAGFIKLVAGLENVGRMAMGAGQALWDGFGDKLSAINEALHGNFRKAEEISKGAMQHMKDDWSLTMSDVGQTWDAANKKADDFLTHMEEVKGKTAEGPEGGGGPVTRKRDTGVEQQILENRRKVAEESIKLSEDQARAEADAHARAQQIALTQSALAQSKNLDDRKHYDEQVADAARTAAQADMDISTNAANAKYEADKAFLEKSIAIHSSGSAQDLKERAKLHGDLQVLELQHSDVILKIKAEHEKKVQDIDKRLADEELKIRQQATKDAINVEEESLKAQEEALSGEEKASQASYTRKEKLIQDAANLHRISNQQELNSELALYAQEEQAAVQLLEKKKALFIQEAILNAQKNGQIMTEEQASRLAGAIKIDNEILSAHEQYLNKVQAAEEAAEKKREATWQKGFSTINSGFNQAISSTLQGTETASQAFTKMFNSMTIQLFQFVAQWILKKTEMWAMDAILGKAAASTQLISEGTSAAALGAAHAAASTAAIPITGPALAPAAGAAMFSEIMGLIGLGMFEEGGIVPMTGIAMLHQGEGVLTEPLMREVRSYNRGETQSSGNTIHLTYAPQVSAIDGASVQRVLNDHLTVLSDAMKKAGKSGNVKASDFLR